MKSPFLRIRLALAILISASAGACSHTGTDVPLQASAYKISAGSPSSQLLATAQFCESKAQSLRETDPAQALGYYLQAAKATLEKAVSGDPESRALYNRSVANASELVFAVRKPTDKGLTVPGPDGEWKITVETPQYESNSLDKIDSLVTADSIKIVNKKKTLRSSTTREGIGGTLVAYQQGTPERLEKLPFRMPIGTSLPTTAVADFSGGNRVRIRIYDTMLSDEVTLSGRKLPLAADYTAALTNLLAYAPQEDVGFKAMRHPEEYLKDTGIFMVEPYHPDKIPVVLIHGLKDQPATWRNAYNELIGDPVIRKNYQFLFFRYPTGFPLTYTSSLLRQHLENFHKWASENGAGPGLEQMVLVGHSMGAVLTSMKMRDSGDILEKEFLIQKINELDVDEDTKSVLRDLLTIEPLPYITRAIMVAGPHRGSKYAKGIVGALGTMLVDLSKKVTTLSFFDTEARPIVKFLTPAGREVILSPADGIRSLRPHNLALMAVVQLPVGKRITYHSIIGNQGKDKIPLEKSSDSVVDYWSSHLDGAASEKIIPSDHSAHDHPEGVAEINRILHEHLKKLGRR